MANSLLVVNADGPETRVALVENGLLAELYIERKRERGIAGNIYKGRVERVLPGMQAAFVNIGLEKSAYIHVSDVRGTPDDLKRLMTVGRGARRRRRRRRPARPPRTARASRTCSKRARRSSSRSRRSPSAPRAPGPPATSRCPAVTWCSCRRSTTSASPGASPRTRSGAGCARSSSQMRPPGSGFIVRTVAEGVPEKDLRADMEFLIKLWNEVVGQERERPLPVADLQRSRPAAAHGARPVHRRRREADHRQRGPSTTASRSSSAPSCRTSTGTIELYDGSEPIFDGYGIEIEIDRALERKVWLKSGGYLIVDEMEALTAIDVNTGRFVGKKSLEDTITQTNLEAAREVAEQLRIRSIGGMIVVDFIDMDRASNRDKVMRVVQRGAETRPQQGDGHAHLGAGPGRDDPQAHARIAAAPPDRALRPLRGQGLHQVPPDHRLRAAARAAPAGRLARGGHGHRRGPPRRRPGAGHHRPHVPRGHGEAAAEADHRQGRGDRSTWRTSSSARRAKSRSRSRSSPAARATGTNRARASGASGCWDRRKRWRRCWRRRSGRA